MNPVGLRNANRIKRACVRIKRLNTIGVRTSGVEYGELGEMTRRLPAAGPLLPHTVAALRCFQEGRR
jgi:hypothetical protein